MDGNWLLAMSLPANAFLGQLNGDHVDHRLQAQPSPNLLTCPMAEKASKAFASNTLTYFFWAFRGKHRAKITPVKKGLLRIFICSEIFARESWQQPRKGHGTLRHQVSARPPPVQLLAHVTQITRCTHPCPGASGTGVGNERSESGS